jgi:hypothetical protein
MRGGQSCEKWISFNSFRKEKTFNHFVADHSSQQHKMGAPPIFPHSLAAPTIEEGL